MKLVLVAMCLAVSAVGCSEPDPVEGPAPIDCSAAGQELAEVGIGDLAAGYIPVPDEADVDVVLGPQGLHMVVVSVRVRGIEAPAGQTVRVTVGLETKDQIVGGSVAYIEPIEAGDWSEFLGLRGVFDVPEIRALNGALVTVTVAVQTDRECLTASRIVRLRL